MCYMNTDSFIGYVKAEILQKMLKARFDTSNYELEWPLSKWKKSNWINERWIKLKNRDTIYWIKSKNLLLLKR